MATGVSERLARLATWRPGSGSTDVRPEERLPVILLAIGAICMPLGIAFVLMGWWGAAHTPYDFEQTPYLISGGLLGIGVLLTGGFLFFGAWIARVALHSQRTTDQLTLLLDHLSRSGQAGAPGLNGGGSTAGSAASAAAATSAGQLVATQTGSMVHRPDCPIVASRDNLRDLTDREAEQMKPCQICSPLSVDA